MMQVTTLKQSSESGVGNTDIFGIDQFNMKVKFRNGNK